EFTRVAPVDVHQSREQEYRAALGCCEKAYEKRRTYSHVAAEAMAFFLAKGDQGQNHGKAHQQAKEISSHARSLNLNGALADSHQKGLRHATISDQVDEPLYVY